LLRVLIPTERKRDLHHVLSGIDVTRFPPGRNLNELFKWHWAVSPANAQANGLRHL
jgi:hypothetical protein